MKYLLNPIKNLPPLSGITCDSREVKPGYAFVAISGLEEDGNNYINEAIARGANIVFTEKDVKQKGNVPIIKVENTRSCLGYLAAEYYDHPSNKLNIIGVTGTNGKTTTTHLIYHLFNYLKKRAGLIGTVNVDTGIKIIPGDLTTPSAVKLQQYLKEMVKNKLKYVCMEISSHGIKLKRISGTNFTIKVGMNISLDHLDLHPNFKEYLNVKKSFLQDYNSNLVLINQDDHHLHSFGKLANNQLNFAVHSKAHITAKEVKNWKMGRKFIYSLNVPLKNNNGQTISPLQLPIKTNIPGDHNIYNSLVVITIALYYEIEPTIIQNFFSSFKGVWRRLQIIYDNKFTIIDDCAHNPGSYEAIFRTIEKMNFKKVFIINSLRGNRGIEINQKNAENICIWMKKLKKPVLFTTNCNDVVKHIDQVKDIEEEIFLQTLRQHKIKFSHFKNLRPALQLVLSKVAENNLILLLGPHAMDHAGEMILEMI